MAKKAAAGKSGKGTKKVGVDFKRLHDEMDAALDRLQGHKPSAKRDALILKISIMRSLRLCPKDGMFAELK